MRSLLAHFPAEHWSGSEQEWECCWIDLGRDPFNQKFRKFRSKTEWIGSVLPGKVRKNWPISRGGPLFSVGPVRSKIYRSIWPLLLPVSLCNLEILLRPMNKHPTFWILARKLAEGGMKQDWSQVPFHLPQENFESSVRKFWLNGSRP